MMGSMRFGSLPIRVLMVAVLAVSIGACARRTAAPITDRKPAPPLAGPIGTPQPRTAEPVPVPSPAPDTQVEVKPIAPPVTVETRPIESKPIGPAPRAGEMAKPATPTPPAAAGRTDVKSEPRAFKAPYSEENAAIVQRGEDPARVASKPGADAKPAAAEAKPPATAATTPPATGEAKPPATPSGVPGPIARVDPQPKPRAGEPDRVDWAWPAPGRVVEKFEGNNKGLAIAGRTGEPVLAAGDGRVVYSGSGLRGYGQLVIIKHNETYISAYAHNSRILVKEGQQVTRGQKIAEMGSSDADRTKLHFEIRRQGKPVDPLGHLPER